MVNQKQTLFQKILKDNAIASQLDYKKLKGSLKFKIFLILTALVIISAFFVLHLDQKLYNIPDYRLIPGSIWEDAPIVAEFSYPIYKEQAKYLEERRLAAESALPVFVTDEASALSNRTALKLYLEDLENIKNGTIEAPQTNLSEKSLRPFIEMQKNRRDRQFRDLSRMLENYLNQAYENGFINISLDRINSSEIMVRVDRNQFIILSKFNLSDKATFVEKAETIFEKVISLDLLPLAMEIVNKINIPNLAFSRELTDQAIEHAMNSVPRTSGFVKAGDVIIHNKEKLTESNIAKIKSYQSTRFMTDEDSYGTLYYLGNVGHAAMVMSILIIYLLILRK
jgi:membrane-associated HD superfamily phosphohydrolase